MLGHESPRAHPVPSRYAAHVDCDTCFRFPSPFACPLVSDFPLFCVDSFPFDVPVPLFPLLPFPFGEKASAVASGVSQSDLFPPVPSVLTGILGPSDVMCLREAWWLSLNSVLLVDSSSCLAECPSSPFFQRTMTELRLQHRDDRLQLPKGGSFPHPDAPQNPPPPHSSANSCTMVTRC